MLLAEARPEDQFDSDSDGLGMTVEAIDSPIAPTAPTPEFLVSDLIGPVCKSWEEATELRLLLLLLVGERGAGISGVPGLLEK